MNIQVVSDTAILFDGQVDSMGCLNKNLYGLIDPGYDSLVCLSSSGDILQVASEEDLIHACDQAKQMKFHVLVLLVQPTDLCVRFRGKDLRVELVDCSPRVQDKKPITTEWTCAYWEVKNVGRDAWENVEAVLLTGEIDYNPPIMERIESGKTTHIRISYRTHKYEACIRASWQLRANNVYFGPKIELNITATYLEEFKSLENLTKDSDLIVEAIKNSPSKTLDEMGNYILQEST